MERRHLILLIALTFTCVKSYSQQGLERYNFDGLTTFIFDEKVNDYTETTKSAIKGQIVISYLDNTVEINLPDSKRKLKLMKVYIETGTLRTMLDLNEDGIKYALAIATKYLTLIGANDRIIYNRTR